MSYTSFGEACPSGWTMTSTGCVSAVATQCPAGFTQRAPGECWPDDAAACATLGMFYNPAQPDRCRKECPSGMRADETGTCRPVSVASIATSTDWSLWTLGAVVAGLAVVVLSRR